jgi:hypothetical protein
MAVVKLQAVGFGMSAQDTDIHRDVVNARWVSMLITHAVVLALLLLLLLLNWVWEVSCCRVGAGVQCGTLVGVEAALVNIHDRVAHMVCLWW